MSKYRKVSFKLICYIFILSLFVHFLEVLIYYFLAKSIGVHISIFALGWIRTLAILATMIPISISGLGVRESMLIFLLRPYGVMGEDAFAFSILIFLVTIFLIGIIGGIFEAGKIVFKVAKFKSI